MHKATILKLYPTKEQADLLYRQLGVVRWCYNHFLALRIRHYKMFGKKDGFKTCNYYRCSSHLTRIKKREKFSYFSIPSSSALQQKLQDLDKAFIGLWKHKRGYPNFKSKRKGNDTMRFDRRWITIKDSKIRIQKVGWIKFRGRLLEGQVRNVTLKRNTFGRYDISIMYEVEPTIRRADEKVGIDMNCHNLTLSTGMKYSLPEYLHQAKIKRSSRIMSRRIKGSNRREKVRKQLAKWHYKAAQARNYFSQRLTSKIAYASETQARVVVLEDLAIDNMTRKGRHKRGLNRSMLDSVWGEIRRQLEYKTATMRAGRFYASSKLCNNCGHKNTALTLSDRKWDCESCRASHDRDVNAALNLVSWATNALRGEKVRPDGMQVPEGIFLGSEKMHR